MMPKELSLLLLGTLVVSTGCQQTEPPQETHLLELVPMVSGAAVLGAPCPSPWTTVRCQSTELITTATGETCVVGTRHCVDGRWGHCEDRVLESELATSTADGVVREGLLGAAGLCGGCDPACYATRDCPSGADDGDPSLIFEGSVFNPMDGGIIIGEPSGEASGRYGWIANTNVSTVTKIDLETRTVVGVYRVGLETVGAASNLSSRTAVDGQGYAYVANRAFNAQGSVTKIAPELDKCVDRNGNGIIDHTSAGLNDIKGWPGALDQDECVLWNVPVGNIDGRPRALVIDAKGRIWVGVHNDHTFVVLDPETGLDPITGAPIATVNVSGCPYGAAIGADGVLWYVDNGGVTDGCHGQAIESVDTTQEFPSGLDVLALHASPRAGYGVGLDGMGRVFLAATQGGLLRFNPTTGGWTDHDHGLGSSRGIVVTTEGLVYVGNRLHNSITEHDANSLDLAVIRTWLVGVAPVSVLGPFGVCPDYQGNIWTAGKDSASVAVIDPSLHPSESVIDPSLVTTDPLAVAAVATQGNNYTYSDFTGYNFSVYTNPTANCTRIFDSVDSCGLLVASTRSEIRYTATTPDPTTITFWGATADTLVGLETANEVLLGAAPPDSASLYVQTALLAAGENPDARFFQVRIELARNGSELSPVFRDMILMEYCQ